MRGQSPAGPGHLWRPLSPRRAAGGGGGLPGDSRPSAVARWALRRQPGCSARRTQPQCSKGVCAGRADPRTPSVPLGPGHLQGSILAHGCARSGPTLRRGLAGQTRDCQDSLMHCLQARRASNTVCPALVVCSDQASSVPRVAARVERLVRALGRRLSPPRAARALPGP